MITKKILKENQETNVRILNIYFLMCRLQATYEAANPVDVVSHVSLYTDYLGFCRKFQLSQPLSSQEFIKIIRYITRCHEKLFTVIIWLKKWLRLKYEMYLK